MSARAGKRDGGEAVRGDGLPAIEVEVDIVASWRYGWSTYISLSPFLNVPPFRNKDLMIRPFQSKPMVNKPITGFGWIFF